MKQDKRKQKKKQQNATNCHENKQKQTAAKRLTKTKKSPRAKSNKLCNQMRQNAAHRKAARVQREPSIYKMQLLNKMQQRNTIPTNKLQNALRHAHREVRHTTTSNATSYRTFTGCSNSRTKLSGSRGLLSHTIKPTVQQETAKRSTGG